jgi:hypothetical protein
VLSLKNKFLSAILIAISEPFVLLVKLAALGTLVAVLLEYSNMGVKLPDCAIAYPY